MESTSKMSVINELKSTFTDIKDKLKKENVTKEVFDELTTNAKDIQDKINELLQKKGVLTQSDINDASILVQKQKRSELQSLNSNTNKNIIFYSLLIGGILIGFYLYKKYKK